MAAAISGGAVSPTASDAFARYAALPLLSGYIQQFFYFALANA